MQVASARMTSRFFYRAAVLGPLLGLVIAALLDRPSEPLPEGWEWVYPTSIAREVMVYALLAVWLWHQLDRLPSADFGRLMWWIPVLFVLFGWAFMFALALLRGSARELGEEYTGRILFRAVVHLAVGYGYVALITLAFRLLREGGSMTETT